jgi:hypothetical protein
MRVLLERARAREALDVRSIHLERALKRGGAKPMIPLAGDRESPGTNQTHHVKET